MVVAKSEHAYSRLKQAFRTRAVDKNYHALVQGLPDPLVGTIDAAIGPDARRVAAQCTHPDLAPVTSEVRGHRRQISVAVTAATGIGL